MNVIDWFSGFWHEQARRDRDDYIKINFNNISPGQEHNFQKKTAAKINHLNSNYDLCSVMHYGPYAFNIVSIFNT